MNAPLLGRRANNYQYSHLLVKPSVVQKVLIRTEHNDYDDLN